MKKLGIFLFILMAAALVAVFTVPTKKDFQEFVKARTEEALADKQGEQSSILQDILNPALISGAAVVAAESADVDDYQICNVFTVRYKKKDFKYVGIYGTFFPLQVSSPLDEMMGK